MDDRMRKALERSTMAYDEAARELRRAVEELNSGPVVRECMMGLYESLTTYLCNFEKVVGVLGNEVTINELNEKLLDLAQRECMKRTGETHEFTLNRFRRRRLEES